MGAARRAPSILVLGCALAVGCSTAGPTGSDVASLEPSSSLPPPSATVAAPSAGPPSAGPSHPAGRGEGFVMVPGTHAGLVPPADFTTSQQFTGFEHGSGASIVVAELPTDVQSILPGLTDEALRGQGITVTDRTDVTIDGHPGLLVGGTQEAAGITVRKLFLATGTDAFTVIFTGNYLDEPADMGDRMRAAFESVGLDPESAVDQQGGLSFDITPAAPLRFAASLTGSAIYNTSGQMPSADPQEPTFIVALSLDKRPLLPNVETVNERVRRLDYLDIEIEGSRPVTIAGLEGFEVTATARDRPTDEDVFVVTTMLFPPDGGYVLMTGESRIEERAAMEPVFAATTASYRPKAG